MKYEIILNNEEIEELLKIEYSSLSDAIRQLEMKFDDFDIKKSQKSQFMFGIATNVSGKIENNKKDLICTNCMDIVLRSMYAIYSDRLSSRTKG